MIDSIAVDFLMDIPCMNIETCLDAVDKRGDYSGYLDIHEHMIKWVGERFDYVDSVEMNCYYDVTITATIYLKDIGKVYEMNTIILNEFNAKLEQMGVFKTKDYKKWLKASVKGEIRYPRPVNVPESFGRIKQPSLKDLIDS